MGTECAGVVGDIASVLSPLCLDVSQSNVTRLKGQLMLALYVRSHSAEARRESAGASNIWTREGSKVFN